MSIRLLGATLFALIPCLRPFSTPEIVMRFIDDRPVVLSEELQEWDAAKCGFRTQRLKRIDNGLVLLKQQWTTAPEVPCGPAPVATVNGATLTIRPVKSSYPPGEPVYLLLDVVNGANKAINLPVGCCTYELTLSGPGITKKEGPNVVACACLVVNKKLQPGERHRERILLNAPPDGENKRAPWLTEHHNLTQSGVFTVKVGRQAGDRWLYAETKFKIVAAPK